MPTYTEIRATDGLIRLEAVAPGIIRCAHTREAEIAPPSLLLDASAWQEGCGAVHETEECAELSSGNLIARCDKVSGRLSWFDASTGEVLLREGGHELAARDITRAEPDGEPIIERVSTVDGERNFIKNLREVYDRRGWRAKLHFEFADDEGIFGLGQAEEGVWNWRHRNQYLYQHNMRTPLPCLLSGRGWGMFVDCCSLMSFRDDERGSYLFLDTVKQLDYYFITGSDPANRFDGIIAGFRKLTGKAVLLPLWAFGYIQSKERYDTAAELAEVVRRYRELGVPLDCVVQDWKYWEEDRWGEKKPDKKRYGDLRARMDEIHSLGAHAIVSVWPNMNSGTADYEEFAAEGLLLNDLSTYDAFSPRAREIYWKQAKAGLFDCGFDGWWCDSTEPFSGPDWNGAVRRGPRERYQLVGGEHKRFLDPEFANIYSLMHAKGIYEHQRRDVPDRRVFNLTRSGYASIQQYGAVLWSGDISARWDVMRAQIAEALNMAASGYPWWTLDIGGFFVVNENWKNRGCGCDNDPSPKWFWQGSFEQGVADLGYRELYVRWLQLGCFLPVFRSHGTDTPREIWNFGAPGEPFYDAIAKFIRLRYRLLPYIYSLAGAVWREDTVMLRPLLFDFAADPNAVATADEFMLGRSLLVCPVTQPMYYGPGSVPLEREKRWQCYLPAGCDWFDFWDNRRYEGGGTVTVDAPLERVPLFVRAGSIIPMTEDIQCTAQLHGAKLTLRVYPGADANFTLYEDAGDGYGYEHGEYVRTELRWDEAGQRLYGAREGMAVEVVVSGQWSVVSGQWSVVS